ncbi:MAG TPA: hypothetical protein VF796_13850 [Humisphaera sp.]
MFEIGVGDYQLRVHRGPLPGMYGEYRRHAALAEEFALDRPDGDACLVAVAAGHDWPVLVVAQRFEPCGGGFDPGVLLVPETGVLFVGAGTRLLAYALDGPRRLWEDAADAGFWGWARHGDVVLMSAELELAAWDVRGRKLWTTFVEPPWAYRVEDDRVRLDVMGRLSSFPLAAGPGPAGAAP